jgi:hypothetical protein
MSLSVWSYLQLNEQENVIAASLGVSRSVVHF